MFDKISTLLRQISGLYDEVVLLPNHIFFLGGDDRLYLSKIKMELSDCSNIYVEHKPKSLSETFEIIAVSKAAIAMRYHAILFQTILNGNNYILDYTDSKIGKIISFLSDIDHEGFYKNRYCNVSSCDKDIQFEFSDDRFRFTYSIYDEIIEFYSDTIRSIL